jgi:hypothetical protein
MSTVLDMRWGQSDPSELYEGATPSRVRAGRLPGAPKTLPYGYTLEAAYRVPARDTSATQWVYTDGLHALSIFRLAGTMRRPSHSYRSVGLAATKAWVGPGPGTWVWQGGRSTWVLVADEPQIDPAVVTEALPQGGPPALSRMGSWWAGAYHWVRAKL